MTWAGGKWAGPHVQEQDGVGKDPGLRHPDHRGSRPSGTDGKCGTDGIMEAC